MKVTIDDAKVLGYCARGCRAFARKHGLDWVSFLREGVDESVLLELDDQMANDVVEQARRREKGNT